MTGNLSDFTRCKLTTAEDPSAVLKQSQNVLGLGVCGTVVLSDFHNTSTAAIWD